MTIPIRGILIDSDTCSISETELPTVPGSCVRAIEQGVRRMSTAGDLAQYCVVHFATHGAVGDQLKASTEPGLILTPPETVSEDDDGYLSASEIAALKLDADRVCTSAWNKGSSLFGGLASSAFRASDLSGGRCPSRARASLRDRFCDRPIMGSEERSGAI
jgi:hypothetical protein